MLFGRHGLCDAEHLLRHFGKLAFRDAARARSQRDPMHDKRARDHAQDEVNDLGCERAT